MKYTITNLGEFRMGAEGHGLILYINGHSYDALADSIVFCNVNQQEAGKFIDYSCDDNYLIIKGFFDTYIIDLKNATISLFRITLRDIGMWCEESPIYGNIQTHINGKNGKHYFIQFPFIPFASFNKIKEQYIVLRIHQINEMKNKDQRIGRAN